MRRRVPGDVVRVFWATCWCGDTKVSRSEMAVRFWRRVHGGRDVAHRASARVLPVETGIVLKDGETA